MRMSDWSSDVCSSDLEHRERADLDRAPFFRLLFGQAHAGNFRIGIDHRRNHVVVHYAGEACNILGNGDPFILRLVREHWTGHNVTRSEEHTSELQSLMRISYAVFCLKKKTKNIKLTYIVYITAS